MIPGGINSYFPNSEESKQMIYDYIQKGVDKFNKNDSYIWTCVGITNLQSQVIAGVIYFIDVIIAKTLINKYTLRTNFNDSSITLEVKYLRIKVTSVPWKNIEEIEILVINKKQK